ncbi:hypothetical protein SAMN05421824_2976 [Hyunsoonleella jejuensis]|uniref:Lipocalin-like domain-containing protein n=1 Tax=Hyunsoonleella jejuensis TaxID=419940 RepID=A0A1H9L822_9FLAO|nr:hypothetical protein [Hyunsoonleella jejuensis]SER07500.1 hypothetical protein SAMN05421824_2976 [Hyunsoonleella jejuensis]
MKTLKVFLFVAVALIFSSCSKDDGPVVIELNATNIEGTYEITLLQSSSRTTSTASNGSEVLIETETSVADTFTNAILTFNANRTYTTSGSFRVTYTLTVTGQNPETESEIVTLDDEGSYSLDSNNNTISLDGDIFDVLSFNGTNITLRGEDTDNFNGETTVTITEIRLVKQN